MIEFFQHNRRARIMFILLSMVIVYFTYVNAHLLYQPLHIKIAWLRLALRGLITSIAMTALLLCIHKPSDILSSMGLNHDVLKGLGLALICCCPLIIGMPIIGSFDRELSLDYFLRMVVLAAFLEELIFRGFLFGQLYRYGRVGFVWAVIVPAALFGLQHLYQGHSLLSSLSAFGVTALGALYFSWVYVKCVYNLWIPIGLHMFMNLCWIVFPVEGNENAVGSVMPNILRVASIMLTITLIIVLNKKKIFNIKCQWLRWH